MTMYLSACQQRLRFEYSHIHIAVLVVSDTGTSLCCVAYVRSITASETFLALYLSNSVVRDSVVITGWAVRGLNPGVGEIFRTRPDRSWGPPKSLYSGYVFSFPGVKRAGRGVDLTAI
jgi:hypothetical protein